jgi:hypothetical protein
VLVLQHAQSENLGTIEDALRIGGNGVRLRTSVRRTAASR